MPVNATSLSNRLLVAVPALRQGSFERSVTLLCQHDGDGAMGVMVNRASEYTVGDVLDQMGIDCADERLRADVVLSGGPVHPERGFVIHDGEQVFDSTLQVGDGLHLTTSRDVLEAMAAGEGPQQRLVALGCAGWGEGQIEQELREDSWLLVPSDPRLLFEVPLEQRWQAAAGSIGVDLVSMAHHSGHA